MAITVPVAGQQGQASWAASVANAVNTLNETANFLPCAYPLGHVLGGSHSASSALIAVVSSNGGAAAQAIWLPGPMLIQSVTIRQAATASARAAEFRIYRDVGTSSASFITGTDGTFSFTPASADDRTANVSVPGTLITPGVVWFVLRNTSTTQTFPLARQAATTELVGNGSAADMTTGIAALGSTIDITAFDTKNTGVFGVRLNGRVFGQTSAF